MKKLVYIIVAAIFLLFPSIGSAQDIPADSLQMNEMAKSPSTEVSFEEKADKILLFIAENIRSEEYYKLYPTTNMWTFIKLDTRTGKLWQVQFSITKSSQTSINLTDLTSDLGTKAGRFELYPTQNISNFILLDRVTGRLWQVQWSARAASRGITPIN